MDHCLTYKFFNHHIIALIIILYVYYYTIGEGIFANKRQKLTDNTEKTDYEPVVCASNSEIQHKRIQDCLNVTLSKYNN